MGSKSLETFVMVDPSLSNSSCVLCYHIVAHQPQRQISALQSFAKVISIWQWSQYDFKHLEAADPDGFGLGND